MTTRELYSKIILLARNNQNIQDEFYVLLNDAIRKVAMDLEMWYKEASDTSDENYAYYALPDNLMEIMAVFYDGYPINKFGYIANKEIFSNDLSSVPSATQNIWGVSTADYPMTWAITYKDNQAVLHFEPNPETGKTIDIIYKSTPNKVSASTQDVQLPLPTFSHDLIDYYLQYLVFSYLRDNKSQESMMLYVSKLKEINSKFGGIDRYEGMPTNDISFTDSEP